VKVLLDECTPRGVKQILGPHYTLTVQMMGWAGLSNGVLLRFAEAEEFEVVVTCDKNMFKEQTVSGRNIAVIELPTNDLDSLVLIASRIREVLNAAQPGNYYRISTQP
jgi:hypothetical protein